MLQDYRLHTQDGFGVRVTEYIYRFTGILAITTLVIHNKYGVENKRTSPSSNLVTDMRKYLCDVCTCMYKVLKVQSYVMIYEYMETFINM